MLKFNYDWLFLIMIILLLRYCLGKVIFNGYLVEWLCYEWQQRSGEVTCCVFPKKVSSERPSHTHSGLTLHQPNTMIVESERDAELGSDGKNKVGVTKYASVNKMCSLEMNSQQKKHLRKKPNVRPKGNCTNGKGCNKIAKKLHSCEMIGTETTKNDSGENQLVDNENSVHSLVRTRHTDLDNRVNQSASVGCKSAEVKSGKDTKKVVGALQDLCLAVASLRNNKSEGHNDSDSIAMDDLMPENKKELVIFQLDCGASDELQQRSMVATVTQQSTLQDDAMDEVMPCSPNMCILAKENIENQNCRENQSEPSILPSEHIENQSRKENQSEPSNLFDQAHSSLSLDTYPVKFLPEGSTVEVETSVEFVKDNPRKRRRLILLDDDDEEEVKAEDVQPEHVDPPCQKCDTPKKNNEIEKTVQTRDLSNSNPSDGGPVKKRRRYIDANEDEDDEAVIDVVNASCAKKDVPNCALNDGANLGSQTAVAKDHSLRSRVPSGSITSDQYYIYSRPLDEPVWRYANALFSSVDLSNISLYKMVTLSISMLIVEPLR
jgi:hypothetical protein